MIGLTAYETRIPVADAKVKVGGLSVEHYHRACAHTGDIQADTVAIARNVRQLRARNSGGGG